jgi:exosortase/archaeosortase family protein
MPVRSFFRRHPDLVRFAMKLGVVYAVWIPVYTLLLRPWGFLDAWLALSAAGATGGMLLLLGQDVMGMGRVVGVAGTEGLEILNAYNGLAAMVLFAAFVLAWPGETRRKAWFIPAGLMAIVVANVVRMTILALMQAHRYEHFYSAQGALLGWAFFLVVFALWAVWVANCDHGVLRRTPDRARMRVSA